MAPQAHHRRASLDRGSQARPVASRAQAPDVQRDRPSMSSQALRSTIVSIVSLMTRSPFQDDTSLDLAIWRETQSYDFGRDFALTSTTLLADRRSPDVCLALERSGGVQKLPDYIDARSCILLVSGSQNPPATLAHPQHDTANLRLRCRVNVGLDLSFGN
jgi:hypothetical protein